MHNIAWHRHVLAPGLRTSRSARCRCPMAAATALSMDMEALKDQPGPLKRIGAGLGYVIHGLIFEPRLPRDFREPLWGEVFGTQHGIKGPPTGSSQSTVRTLASAFTGLLSASRLPCLESTLQGPREVHQVAEQNCCKPSFSKSPGYLRIGLQEPE